MRPKSAWSGRVRDLKRWTVLSKRYIERVAGILFIVLFVAFAIAILTGEPEVDFNREDVRESLIEVIDDQETFVTSVIFFLVGSLLLVAAAAALYRVFAAHDRMLALFVLVGILSGGLLIAVAALFQFGAFFLARDFVDGVADADTLASTARVVALVSSVTFLTGLTMLGAGMLPLGVLMVRTRAAPRWLGYWAIVSGIPDDGGLGRRQHRRSGLHHTGHRRYPGGPLLPRAGHLDSRAKDTGAGLGLGGARGHLRPSVREASPPTGSVSRREASGL